jgi:hypothetical protein
VNLAQFFEYSGGNGLASNFTALIGIDEFSNGLLFFGEILDLILRFFDVVLLFR